MHAEAVEGWFTGSKALCAKGLPLLVYHGTADDFDAFVPSTYDGVVGGIFFTPDFEVARQFAHSAQESTGEDGRVIGAVLAIRNPKQIHASEIMNGALHSFAREFAAVAAARAEGFDGLVIRDVPEHGGRVADQWVALSPDQVQIVSVTLIDELEPAAPAM
ncbi:ADP-ribosyltransferase-containing protein [Pseudoxanthomonas kaohsiungensis]|uniref:ART-PolyVal-like domain-containing protein n=1 Tax=Pseudoxanthomonas kaohsiungensis TaxID=283923 RepID=A0ABW3LZ64_9GAMM|nr:hypothetical protein [Pseudoxanthomonas kaohsiungensis]KAF1702893.1 hypothetical protein CSC66_08960 [Pseudoxanthomonas kaohsiungensis]